MKLIGCLLCTLKSDAVDSRAICGGIIIWRERAFCNDIPQVQVNSSATHGVKAMMHWIFLKKHWMWSLQITLHVRCFFVSSRMIQPQEPRSSPLVKSSDRATVKRLGRYDYLLWIALHTISNDECERDRSSAIGFEVNTEPPRTSIHKLNLWGK